MWIFRCNKIQKAVNYQWMSMVVHIYDIHVCFKCSTVSWSLCSFPGIKWSTDLKLNLFRYPKFQSRMTMGQVNMQQQPWKRWKNVERKQSGGTHCRARNLFLLLLLLLLLLQVEDVNFDHGKDRPNWSQWTYVEHICLQKIICFAYCLLMFGV